MKQSVWNKKFPTLFGILFLVVGLGISTWAAINFGFSFNQHASALDDPQNVQITNITDTSFSVSYTTQEKTAGFIAYGTGTKLGKLGLDERDQQTTSPTPYGAHQITVHQLAPNTTYYFSITSGSKTYLNNGQLYTVKTGEALTSTPPKQLPLAGKILLPDGTPAKDTLVYVSGPGTQLLAGLTQADGTFSLPLNAMRALNNNAYQPLNPQDKLNIVASDGQHKTAASVFVNQSQPIPPMTLSQTYDFTQSTEPLVTQAATNQQGSLPTSQPNVPNTDQPVTITNPQSDNQQYTDQQPKFTGTAIPNSQVSITIHSDTAATTVTSNATGQWNYRPTSPLPSGAHTIVVSAKDALGVVHQITKTFVIFASGTQVAEAATPSATPIVTAVPTVLPTDTPAITQPVATDTPVITQIISQQPITPPPSKLPNTGSSITIVAGIVGTVIMGFGVLLLIL